MFREKVIRLLNTIIANSFSVEFCESVVSGVGSFLPVGVDLVGERRKLEESSGEFVEQFDMLMRGLAELFHLIICKLEQTTTTTTTLLPLSYQYILQLGQLTDEDTWISCLQSWVIYYKHNL